MKPRCHSPHQHITDMNKRINSLLRKCKTLSRQLSRSSSYSSLRSKSAREADYYQQLPGPGLQESEETIFVGNSRRRYVISSKHLNHPLLSALIQKSKRDAGSDPDLDPAVVKCEVVLFDHLLWMLENADPNNLTSELAELYVY